MGAADDGAHSQNEKIDIRCGVAYIQSLINPFLFQELHWGDKAAWSICLWAQPALGTSGGVLYIRLLEKYAPLHIRNIGSQEQALGIWQLTHTWKVSAIFHLLQIDPAMFKLNLKHVPGPVSQRFNLIHTGDKMPVNEDHQTNTLREAFLQDSIVIKQDKMILLITYLCFWTNIFDT